LGICKRFLSQIHRPKCIDVKQPWDKETQVCTNKVPGEREKGDLRPINANRLYMDE